MNDSLDKLVGLLHGKVIAIDISTHIVNTISKNKNVEECVLLYSNSDESSKFNIFNRNISLKKMKKMFKKKKHQCLIMSNVCINDIFIRFPRDSIYMISEYIYIYGSEKVFASDELIKRYNRYNVKIDKEEFDNNYVLKINVKNAKNNWFKDFIYLVIDYVTDFFDLIAALLIN